MRTLLSNFVKEEQGQDLIEYTLLLAFVCLASAALFISAGGSVGGIWSATNSRLAAANTSASWSTYRRARDLVPSHLLRGWPHEHIKNGFHSTRKSQEPPE